MGYKIPGWMWLACGIIMSVYSQIVNSSTENNMMPFFYVGLFFLAIGIFKIVVSVITNPKVKVAKQSIKEDSSSTENNFKIIYCPSCKSKTYSSYRHCQNCGFKLN